MNHPNVLVFPDRRERGRYTVRDGQGRTVARIATTWTGTTFTASDADGQPLCAAAARWLGLSGTWHATGPDGQRLLRVHASSLRRKATVTLPRGETLIVQGSVRRRDFTATDSAGRTLLTAVPRTSAMSFHPHDYAISQPRPALGLPELVALVQIWRMIRKAESDATAASTAAMTATFTG